MVTRADDSNYVTPQRASGRGFCALLNKCLIGYQQRWAGDAFH